MGRNATEITEQAENAGATTEQNATENAAEKVTEKVTVRKLTEKDALDRRLEKDRLDEIIGKNIRLERESRRLSRDELAEMMDLTSSHMGLIERGERGATAVTLSKLARAFGVPIDNLFANPRKSGLSVKEDRDDTSSANRKKVQSLLTCLDDIELEFIIHAIKGLIAMSHNISARE